MTSKGFVHGCSLDYIVLTNNCPATEAASLEF